MELTQSQKSKILESLDAVSDSDLEARYNTMLDEAYSEVSIAGYTYNASHALKSIDPVAYRVGLSDFIDGELEETLIELAGEYFVLNEVIEFLNSEADDE